jgi:beta-glucosidase
MHASRWLIVGLAAAASAGLGAPLGGQGLTAATPPAAAAIDLRVAALVAQMTLEEKVLQLQHDAPAIERLGVPAYNWWNEGLHGVARAGRATVFPQAIGLAATWDTALLRRVATAISDEARAKHHDFVRRGKRGLYEGLTFWSPNINIFRDPRWGRGMETYGEDPFLAGTLAVEFVRGLQGDDPYWLRTVATPKHFAVHSGPESSRHEFDAVVDERDLRETYLPQFEMAVREGGAISVMCAYNRYLGEPACASPLLLGSVLRGEWGFGGYVVSDCDAVDDMLSTHKLVRTPAAAAALGLRGGCDLNCGTTYAALVEAVREGLVTEAEVDRAVTRLLTVRFRLGMFDPPEATGYGQLPIAVVDSPAHRELALAAARASIVLLKNEGGVLPFGENVRRIAVVGPNADDEEVLLGNYNGTPTAAVTPLAGLRRALGARARVTYARGADWADGLPALEVVPGSVLRTRHGGRRAQGLTGEYFDLRAAGRAAPESWHSAALAFPSLGTAPVFTRVDARLDLRWFDGTPDPRLADDAFAVRWSGELVPPATGDYLLGGSGLTGFRVWLDDELVVEFKSRHESSRKTGRVRLEKGRAYRLRVEYFDGGDDARFQLLWTRLGPDRGRDLLREALRVARRADVVVAVLGLSPRLEGEEMAVPVAGFAGGDRVDLGLPAAQQALLEALAALGKPVVLVLLNGSALAIPWAAQHVGGLVEAWYPGQAAGEAIADVLLGTYNPAGRLPVTFYASVDQLPPFDDYRMASRTYRYFRGTPLYPFGHGLSYTTFAYRDLKLPAEVAAGETIAVSVEVTNTGVRAGEEVVQLYVSDLEASVPVPTRSLAGFRRVALQPGERRTVAFTVARHALSLLDAELRQVVEPGWFEISVGGTQPGTPGATDATDATDATTTHVLTGRVRVTGGAIAVR